MPATSQVKALRRKRRPREDGGRTMPSAQPLPGHWAESILPRVETELSRHVRARFERVHGYRATGSTLMAASGNAFSRATANKILAGQHGMPDETTLRGLSTALREPISAVRRAVGLAPHDLGEFRLPARASRLTSKQRQVVLSVVDAMLDASEAAAARAARRERSLSVVAHDERRGGGVSTYAEDAQDLAQRLRRKEDPAP